MGLGAGMGVWIGVCVGSGGTNESGKGDGTGSKGALPEELGVGVDVRARLVDQYLGRRCSRTIEVFCCLH